MPTQQEKPTGRPRHVVVGVGPVGRAIINELSRRGVTVRAVARRRPKNLVPTVEFVQADVTDADEARRATAGAAVVYHAASAPYHRWAELLPPIMDGLIAGAGTNQARIVYADNLYAYGEVEGLLQEQLPARASGPNGRLRAALADRLMGAHASGAVQATIGRASDYFGPHGRESTAGDRLFERAIAGRAAQVLGDPEQPHTYTYLSDFARALITLGTEERALGEIWHVPSAPTITTRQFAELVFERAGKPARLQVLPGPLVTVLGMVSPMMRAVSEQQYQRVRPWIVDHSKFEHAFGATTTAHQEAIAATLDWYMGATRALTST